MFRCAYRHPYTDFARSFGDGDQHDIHDSDSTDDQRYRTDNSKQHGHRQGSCCRRLSHFVRAANAEVVIFTRPQMMALSQQAEIPLCADAIACGELVETITTCTQLIPEIFFCTVV